MTMAKVSPEVPSQLYEDDITDTNPPEVKLVNDSTLKDSSEAHARKRQAPDITVTPGEEERLSPEHEQSVDFVDEKDRSKVNDNGIPNEPTQRKLGFKAAAEKVRRNSVDSIGQASDLLHPDSAAAAGNKDAGLDEPDFWDKMSQFSVRMRKDSRFYFQHPYARLLIAYLVTFCNFLIYAEDPVAHSSSQCNIPVVGNIYSFVVTKYPPNGFSALKVILWLIAIVAGCLVGKLVIHKILLKRLIKLQMFQEDNGSFMIMFLTTLLFLFAFSWLYNAFLLLGGEPMKEYAIDGFMSMKNSTFMKAAACGTWLGDFFTAWMVTDVMLQEKFYPGWARGARRWWNRGKHRIILFWCMALLATIIVIMVISTDWIRWDAINASFLATNELSRAFLASFILVMDLLIVMQDWDFPHFVNHFDIKLPGLNTSDFKINIPRCLKRFEKITIHITGKWFNYGIIFLVMLLDLNMWKNQIFYAPQDYGQYVDSRDFICSYRSDELYLIAEGGSLLQTNGTDCDKDVRMESVYKGFSLPVKAIAFIPSLAAFAAFVALIIIYGRVKPTKADPYGGRLQKVPKSKKISMFTIVKMKFMRKKQSEAEVSDTPVAGGDTVDGIAYKTSKGEVNMNINHSNNTIDI